MRILTSWSRRWVQRLPSKSTFGSEDLAHSRSLVVVHVENHGNPKAIREGVCLLRSGGDDCGSQRYNSGPCSFGGRSVSHRSPVGLRPREILVPRVGSITAAERDRTVRDAGTGRDARADPSASAPRNSGRGGGGRTSVTARLGRVAGPRQALRRRD